MTLTQLAETSRIPDALIRAGIRHKVKTRLQEVERLAGPDPEAYAARFARELEALPIAVHTKEANRQHYELPAAFFAAVLGPRRKYSSGFWGPGVTDLAGAEEAMLALAVERADIRPGHRVLDLGCGWGSLSLYLAERFPDCRITGVSNSHSQRTGIMARADERRLTNLEIITADARVFETGDRFDRVVSIEMFEHMKNYRLLMDRITEWLVPGGRLFLHVFAHRMYPYHFEAGNAGEWMARHFFTGGLMPSVDLLPRFAGALVPERTWEVSGVHYERTANAWLRNQDAARGDLEPLFRATYGEDAERWWGRWRIFFMACAELFGYRGGTEWVVAHHRFAKSP